MPRPRLITSTMRDIDVAGVDRIRASAGNIKRLRLELSGTSQDI
jgi:hypothetical protein